MQQAQRAIACAGIFGDQKIAAEKITVCSHDSKRSIAKWKRDFFLPSPSAEKIVLRKIKMLFTFETDVRDRKSYFINLTK